MVPTVIESHQPLHAKMELTKLPGGSTPHLQAKWALSQIRKAELCKSGATMGDEKRAWLTRKLTDLAAAHGFQAVEQAIDACLEDSPYMPDISEIRARLGVTSSQAGRAKEENDARQAAEAWAALGQYLRYADRDMHGNWSFIRTATRNKRDESGNFVMVTGPKGYLVVAQEPVPVPEMPRRSAWCIEHIGGLGKVMETPDRYRDVLRREFLKAWPLYTEGSTELQVAGDEPISAILQRDLSRAMEMPSGRA